MVLIKEILSSDKLVNKTNIILGLVFVLLIITNFFNFLLFHSFVEIFSIIISFMIFVIAIYTHEKITNNFLIIIGVAYGFIGGFDLIHTLAYKGMGVFKNSGSDLPTQLWIIARYLESFSFLLALWFINFNKKYQINKVIYFYLSLSIVLLGSLYLNIFPTAFIEGQGLTQFKIVSEYIVSGLLILGLYLLYLNKKQFAADVYNLIFVSISMTILAEISFTFYVDVYGLSNVIGHIFKLLSVMLVFKAIIETGFKRPYDLLFRELKSKKDEITEKKDLIENIYNNIEQGLCLHEIIYDNDNKPIDYKILDVNKAYEKLLNISKETAVGSLGSKLYNKENPPYIDIYAKTVETKNAQTFEVYYEPIDKHLNITVTSPKEGQFITLFNDITEIKKREKELKNKYQEVKKLSNDLESIIYLTNRLSITSKHELDEFLSDVLKISFSFIDIVDYGYSAIYKNGHWKVINKKGYNNNIINLLNQKRDLIIKSQDNIFELDLIRVNNKDIRKYLEMDEMSQELKEHLNKISKMISESIYFDLEVRENYKIRVSLDISAEKNKTFDENDLKVIKAFRNLINVFLKQNLSQHTDEIKIFED